MEEFQELQKAYQTANQGKEAPNFGAFFCEDCKDSYYLYPGCKICKHLLKLLEEMKESK